MQSQILLSAGELKDILGNEKTRIIDTRDPEQYAAGHIPGATNIREIFTYLATSDSAGTEALKDTFASLFAEAGVCQDSRVVFYEDSMNTGFGQSCRGYFLLTALGHPNAAVLHGGLEAWKTAGLPLSNEPGSADRGDFAPAAQRPALIATRSDVLEAIDDPSVVLLDVRDRDEWEGYSSSPYGVDFCPRKGRLPNAVWIEWYDFMDENGVGTFRSNAEILEMCHKVGITRESRVLVYCFKGARASNTFVALRKAGIENIQIYLGSWNEWSRDFELPIDDRLIPAV